VTATFRLFIESAEQPDPPTPAELRALHPRIRPHCARCGRWVAEASVRKLWPRPWEADENEYQGTCSLHGERVDVIWDEG
jgi:hypothetical protein